MRNKIALILLALVLLAVFAYAVTITGQGLNDLTPSETGQPGSSKVIVVVSVPQKTLEVVEGNPFSASQFEKSTGTQINKECQECASILQCLACLDRKMVDDLFPAAVSK